MLLIKLYQPHHKAKHAIHVEDEQDSQLTTVTTTAPANVDHNQLKHSLMVSQLLIVGLMASHAISVMTATHANAKPKVTKMLLLTIADLPVAVPL